MKKPIDVARVWVTQKRRLDVVFGGECDIPKTVKEAKKLIIKDCLYDIIYEETIETLSVEKVEVED